jgi:hypothetical protein
MIAILISLAYIVKTELFDRWRTRRQRTDRQAPSQRLDAGYGLMTRTLARLGLPRHVWETPAEYAVRAMSFLTVQEAALGVPLRASVVSAVTDRFVSARYSDAGHVSAPGLDQDLHEFVRAAARARRLQAWRRFLRLRPLKEGA